MSENSDDATLGLIIKKRLQKSGLHSILCFFAAVAWTAAAGGMMALVDKFFPGSLIAVGFVCLIWFIGSIGIILKMVREYWKAIQCPNCGHAFNMSNFGNVPFARKCHNCGLQLPRSPRWFAAITFVAGAVGVCAIVVLLYFSATDVHEPKQYVKVTKIILAEAAVAVEHFYSDCKRLPATPDELISPPAECKSEPYIKRPLKDGWGNRIQFEIVGPTLRMTSFGEDGKVGGDGRAADIVHTWPQTGSPE